MRVTRALERGFTSGREKLFGTLALFATALVGAQVASGPLRAAFHAALDPYPASRELLGGGGVDLLAELGLHQPGLFGGAFGAFLPALLGAAALSLFFGAGLYASAARPAAEEEKAAIWRTFWALAARNVLPMALVVLLNLLAWGLVSVLVFLPLVGVAMRLKDATDPGALWNLFCVELCAAWVLFGLYRASSGFGRAWYALAGGNPAKAFLRGFAFSLRTSPVTAPLTWLFAAIRIALLALAVKAAPGHVSAGAAVATFLFLEAAFFSGAFLRVAEIRTQVAYLALKREAPAAVPAPPPSSVPDQPAEAPTLSSTSL